MVEPLRRRQTKGAETDMLDLTPPRHASTLPRPPEAARHRASQDDRPSTGYGAPLTAHFNRNFGTQEIDGELRRPLRFEPAAGGARGFRATDEPMTNKKVSTDSDCRKKMTRAPQRRRTARLRSLGSLSRSAITRLRRQLT